MSQRFVKKLGDPHAETIQVMLTESQRSERRKLACDLRDKQAALAEEKKLKMSEFTQRKKALENQEAIARGEAATGIQNAAVMVQDYLTSGNEVVSVRLEDGAIDSDDSAPIVVSKRTATAEELQEELFGGSDEEQSH